MPGLPAQAAAPEGERSTHLCGAEIIWNSSLDQRSSNGTWTRCPSCGWVKNDPMVEQGSGWDPVAKRLDVGAQKFWCLRCGGGL